MEPLGRRSPVESIADDRMPNGSQMNSDLMAASGFDGDA